MSFLSNSVALLAGALVLLLACYQALAFTESENLGYIEKILGLLNNKEKCQLPTYEEIDDLQTSFNELRSIWGAEFETKLTTDQKLALETVLDQWTSFQRYLTGGSVTSSAKKRSFLGKVERYQEGKHGFSICTQHPEDRDQDSGVYEKNPLVRYVKQLKTGGLAVAAPQPDVGEGSKVVDDNTDGASANVGGSNKSLDDDADVVFKFKVHPDDPKGKVRQYGGKFTYRDGKTPHRITLNIHKK